MYTGVEYVEIIIPACGLNALPVGKHRDINYVRHTQGVADS